jgi:hypothetical protein
MMAPCLSRGSLILLFAPGKGEHGRLDKQPGASGDSSLYARTRTRPHSAESLVGAMQAVSRRGARGASMARTYTAG